MGSAPLILVVAGHDPSHGAGIDADREALAGEGAAILPVLTAHTDQDGRSFRRLGARPAADWLEEACAALEKRPAAIKFGVLPGRAHLRAAAELVAIARARLGAGLPIVIDPVLGSSTGGRFVDDEGVREYGAALLPLGVVWTPNLPEAAELRGCAAQPLAVDLAERLRWACAWVEAGAAGVVLKGGHGSEDPVMDLVVDRREGPYWHAHPRLPGAKLRGSGCRYASTLAVGLARQEGLVEAAGRASRRLAEALAASAGKR